MKDEGLPAELCVHGNIERIDADAVTIGFSGRTERVAIVDIPEHLCLEGLPIFLIHDEEGYVTAITSRKPEPLSQELQSRIDAVLDWVGKL